MTTKANQKIRKLYNAEIKSVDKDDLTIRFQVSDDSEDRYGEKVKQDWSLKNFTKNPIGLWNHRGGKDIEPEDVMATWKDFESEGGKSFATAQFDAENPKAVFVFGQYARKFLRAVSVGFIPHKVSFEDATPILEENELMEISFVPIPANANAVALAYKAGEIRKEDAMYLMKSMKESVEALETQFKAAEDAENGKTVQQLTDELAEAQKRADEAEQATTDAETARDEAQAKVTELETAKDGDDQSGAGDDEEDDIDLDAELTPELEAQIEESLTPAAA